MSTLRTLIAGFGGQGSLFFGKVISYCGLHDDKNVTNLPSYGPEMRGGTANCSVIISDEEISSPLVLNPDTLVVMNLPSYDKFVGTVAPGGNIILDSTLIDKKVEREDITAYYVPAAELAEKHNLQGLANIILLGKFLAVTGFTSLETVEKTFEKVVPAKKAHLIPKNIEAVKLGMEL
ncbi:MAG: 2-oxoacid:acceptor oxidoreductase family protein [Oscillospiraceae bacterium]|jgi:2-oxoglutarate ferredoxin oxidoreductase subunit gamma|nr:2-oxoacid:acceptor oxidoreductase family protein [Oscillospiraceae bacterium]